jgi:hypothetical protein
MSDDHIFVALASIPRVMVTTMCQLHAFHSRFLTGFHKAPHASSIDTHQLRPSHCIATKTFVAT